MYSINIPGVEMVETGYPMDEGAIHTGRGAFNTTHWSLVLAAGETTSPRSSAALEQLCRTYWYPLYAFVRRRGHGPDDAQDLVQEFFALFLRQGHLRLADRNRGHFRTFLLTALKNFLINEWKKSRREKRGGDQPLLSLDHNQAENRYCAEPATDQPPDALYDQGWASVLISNAMATLATELEASGKREQFERLKGFIWGKETGTSYAEIAERLGVSEGVVKVTVHRLRQRFGELLRAEVAQTVATPVEVDEELRYLIAVIRSGLTNSGNLGAMRL